MMRITEEIVILALGMGGGGFHHSLSEHHRGLAIAGAVLIDLALENRIQADPEALRLIDSTALNDNLLDATLADIASAAESHDSAWWIARTARRSAEITEKAIARLIDRGVLSRDENGAIYLSWLVSRLRRYPEIEGETRDDVATRILRILFSDDIPDKRDVLIISLAAACKVFETMLPAEQLAQAQGRIKRLTQTDLIGRTVADSIRPVASPSHPQRREGIVGGVVAGGVRAAVPPSPPPGKKIRPFEEIPEIPGLPVLGNGLQMAGDINAFVAKSHLKYGPIFRVQTFGRRYVVLAGPEANELAGNISATHLRTLEIYTGFNAAAGASRVCTSMDGPEHLRMRKVLANGLSPKPFEARLDAIHAASRRIVRGWREGRPISIRRAMIRLFGEQLGIIGTSTSPTDHIDDISLYFNTLVSVHLGRLWPALAKQLPGFRRAERRLRVFVGDILAAHEPHQRAGEAPDLVDSLLEVNNLDPQLMPETDLFINVLGPYLVGVDTAANACSFMLHALLKHPQLLERVRAEADEMFESGPPTLAGLRKLDVTRRVYKESLRMYPIVPGLIRIASNSFEFGGYRVPAGKCILVALGAGNHVPEYFPDPHKFDIERWSRGASLPLEAHKAYAPLGVGTHRCPGASLAELQIQLTVATIVREAEVVLDKPERPAKIKCIPVRHLGDATKFRVLRHRGGAVPTSSCAASQVP